LAWRASMDAGDFQAEIFSAMVRKTEDIVAGG
jgi:hypothetical protein